MQLDKVGQAALLKLSEIDTEITVIRNEIAKTIDSEELRNLQSSLSASAADLLEARTKFENVELSVRRSEEDIRLVTERLVRDRTRLNQTSNPKDAMGIQSEIANLERRKSELEEVEIGLLGDLDEATADLQRITDSRSDISAQIEALQSSLQEKVDELKSKGRKLTADRTVVLEKIPQEILNRYTSLSARQPAVGQIVDRACTACRMTMTVGAIDSLSSLPEDQVGICPECQAIIIR